MALHHDTASTSVSGVSAATVRRAACLSICLAAGMAAWMLGDPAPALARDSALANLLRGMAALKALMALGVGAVVWWRLGRPIGAPLAMGYGAGVAVLCAGAVSIWQVSFIGPVAIAFHAALIALLVMALKDDAVALRAR
jgi:hypothetical protein